jgi:hypothetical protein
MMGCRSTAERFVAKDLKGWAGLPANCPADGLQDWFPGLAGEGHGTLGSDEVEYRFYAVVVDGFPEPVRFYTRRGLLAVIRAEYWTVDPAEGAATLDRLGEPAARQDLVWRHQVIAGGEWVYADRGLAFGVLSQTMAIVTAAGFAPCSVENYSRCYTVRETTHELRKRG